MGTKKFWLYDWIDEYGITSVAEARSLISDATIRRRLQREVEKVPFTTEGIDESAAPTIVAGQAIDLSGHLDCYAWGCKRHHLDNLFKHVLHYFDRIVVVGPAAHTYARDLSHVFDGPILERFLTDIQLLLHIRETGAESLLVFRQKRPPCETHLAEHLGDVGFDLSKVITEDLVESILMSSDIDLEDSGDRIDYAFSNSEFEHTVWGSIPRTDRDLPIEVVRAVVESVLRRYLASLASDLYTAKVLASPLGSTVKVHSKLLGAFQSGLQEGEVAFQIQLPVIENLAMSQLIELREGESLHFERFRESIRIAIRERLSMRNREDASAVAREIEREVINPALREIEMRLRASRTVAAKKSALSLGVGAVVTTFGLLTENPFVVAAGAGPAIGYTIAAGQKLFEENRDVTLSDMYFLWQAHSHVKNN